MAVSRIIDHIASVGTTIGTGSTDLGTYSPPNSVVGGLLLFAAGKSNAATPLVCRRMISATYTKSNAGVLALRDINVIQQTTDLALLTTNVTLVAVSGAVVVRATGGLLGTDLEWGFDLFISIT